MVLRRSLKTIQSEENSIQVPRHCKTEECSKRDENCKIRTRGTASCALHLTPYAIRMCHRDPCKLFYLFRKLTVQGNGQTSKLPDRGSLSSSCSY
ncbi:hypothetical protein MTR_2g043220 [Medicago truncatula]|uniref:Uncharacterized protein n=1 Tax=Medicago truncatula TaxID=3880 RepID=A0A072V6A7_MEDTR|nr:hypothetical protein MTR_2g043220 [Medicago truncatula]